MAEDNDAPDEPTQAFGKRETVNDAASPASPFDEDSLSAVIHKAGEVKIIVNNHFRIIVAGESEIESKEQKKARVEVIVAAMSRLSNSEPGEVRATWEGVITVDNPNTALRTSLLEVYLYQESQGREGGMGRR